MGKDYGIMYFNCTNFIRGPPGLMLMLVLKRNGNKDKRCNKSEKGTEKETREESKKWKREEK
jgi:hypothetical protein